LVGLIAKRSTEGSRFPPSEELGALRKSSLYGKELIREKFWRAGRMRHSSAGFSSFAATVYFDLFDKFAAFALEYETWQLDEVAATAFFSD
jgi:hypothetical protein